MPPCGSAASGDDAPCPPVPTPRPPRLASLARLATQPTAKPPSPRSTHRDPTPLFSRQTKRLIAAAAVAPWVPELVLRTTLISGYLILASLFVKAHDIFEYPLGVPLPPPNRR